MSRILWLGVILLFSGPLYAQYSFGGKAGVNFSSEPVGNPDYSTGFLTRFNGGVWINRAFASYGSGHIAGQAEILYSGEGTSEKYIADGSKGSIKRAFIQVPLLLQYAWPEWYVETGPRVAILLSSTERFNDTDEDIMRYYHTLSLGWSLGAGYRLDRWLKGLGINARWTAGLSRLNKEEIAGTSLRSKVFSLDLVYTLPSGNK